MANVTVERVEVERRRVVMLADGVECTFYLAGNGHLLLVGKNAVVGGSDRVSPPTYTRAKRIANAVLRDHLARAHRAQEEKK